MIRTFALAAFLAAPAAASTPAAWNALDTKAVDACTRAATEIKDTQVGPAVRFSDGFGVDVREVTGTYKPRHMLGKKARMYCLYDRRSGRAEVQDKPIR